MLILLFALLQLRFEVGNARLKLVEDAHDAGLLGEGGKRELKLCHIVSRDTNNLSSSGIHSLELQKTIRRKQMCHILAILLMVVNVCISTNSYTFVSKPCYWLCNTISIF